MTDKKFDYKITRAEILIQYGIELDETSISILFILLVEQNKMAEVQNKKLDEAAKNINFSSKSLQADWANPRLQAFWFGMGQWGLGLILAVIVSGTFYGYILNAEMDNQQVQFNFYENYYKKVEALRKNHKLIFSDK